MKLNEHLYEEFPEIFNDLIKNYEYFNCKFIIRKHKKICIKLNIKCLNEKYQHGILCGSIPIYVFENWFLKYVKFHLPLLNEIEIILTSSL